MSKVVIAGGSVAGVASALAIAQHGHQVVVLERGKPPPEGLVGSAGQRWARPTVPSWRHAHTLTSLGVSVLLHRAPQVIAAALDAGGVLLDLVQAMPAHPPGRIAGDEELLALACRRSTLELALYRIGRELPGVEIRHGARIHGLTFNAAQDRITGVLTARGEHLPADIVIDATGRRAEARSWLTAAGIGLAADLTSPSGMRIFTRFYHRRGQPPPLNRGNGAGVLGDHYAGILHPADDRTFSVAFGVLPEDRTMLSLRHPTAFTAAAMATPGVADWLTQGMSTPISEIRPITCPPNMLRTLATSWPQPVAGLLPVGDAACVTNPLYGRGVSLAFAHAFRIGDLLKTHPDAGHAQSREATRIARDLFSPWYQQATQDDAERIARWRAAVNGDTPPPRPQHLTLHTVGVAARGDANIWRGLIRVLMGLRPPVEIFGDLEFDAQVRRVLDAETPGPPALTRAELVNAVTGGDGR